MKKTNNKFRNNNNNSNNIYSLNYKFDSVSIAGKFNGTALDLIKRYNELAKEAQSRGDYVDMEVYRQYAEHYRKIVTEINARKNQNRENNTQTAEAQSQEQTQDAQPDGQGKPLDNGLVETEAAPREDVSLAPVEKTAKKRVAKRSFTVIEVAEGEKTPEESANENVKAENADGAASAEEKPKKRRVLKRKTDEANA